MASRSVVAICSVAALALGAVFWLGASRLPVADANGEAGARGGKSEKTWACPMPEHAAVYDAPGTCPICGMQLVSASTKATRVAILIFPGVQIIDFTGPYEVFGGAGFDTFTVASKPEPMVTAMGMTVTPRYTLADAPPVDVIVIPGGNVDAAIDDPRVLDWIRARAPAAKVVLSVCNGAFTLASTGLLDGLSATTYAPLLDQLRRSFPKVRVVDDRRFVDNGKIVTAAGLSAGLDASLHVVEKLAGRERAERLARNLEHPWDPDGLLVRTAPAAR